MPGVHAIALFVGAIFVLVLGAWVVSKVTGARAYMLEDWAYGPGESVLWRDAGADVALVTRLGSAVSITPAFRLRRWSVVVTTERVLLGEKTLSGKFMVKYVLYPGPAPRADAQKLDGGLLTTGYSTVVFQPGVFLPHLDEKLPYVVLRLGDAPSSANLSEVRIYTDHGATFRLP